MNDAHEEAYRARIRAARKAEVEAAKATIAAHEPQPADDECAWCPNPRAYTIVLQDGPLRLHTCEAHTLRALEGGRVTIEGDEDGRRAAELIARAAVLRVKRGPA